MVGPVDLCGLSFDNSFVRDLPADPLRQSVPRQVRGACYTLVDPTPAGSPTLLECPRRHRKPSRAASTRAGTTSTCRRLAR
jgi:hypothetical protein